MRLTIPAGVLPDSALHGCFVAHISSNHQHIDTWRLLLQLLALRVRTAIEQHMVSLISKLCVPLLLETRMLCMATCTVTC